MATYINYGEGEVDTALQGSEWLLNTITAQQGPEAGKAFANKFKAIHEEHENQRQYNYAPVFDLFVEYSEDLFQGIPGARGDERTKDVESFFALIFSMLLMLDETEKFDQATTRLCEIFTAKTDQQPELRLRLLMMLYNTFTPSLEFRYRVFKYILDYANQASLFDQVLPYLEFLDAWMADWGPHINLNDKRTLFLDVATYMRNMGKRVDSFLHLKRYHQLYQSEEGDVLKDKTVHSSTVQLLVDAVSLPSVIQFDDLLSLDTVKALAKTKDKDLVELCKVFYSGTVNDLRDFQKKHAALFKQHEIEFQECMSKIKLLTLATLALHRSEITLAEIAKKLDESEEDVERWVVRAISEGIIDGRIDQLNHKVIVKSAFQRKFEKEEWAFLDSKLSQWIDNLESVITHIGKQKAARDTGLAAIVN
jgi:translation initiation factor 3 subunit M